MSEPMRAAELLGAAGPLSRSLPGYEAREAQLRMAQMVEDALEHEGVALIEAGTGTGKTLAYLVPAIRSGRKVVVATHTKTLQDQIMERDLPLLERHLGLPIRAACMKGLANYLCRRRSAELLRGPDADRPSIARRLPMLTRWLETTRAGDRAELDRLAEDDPLWMAVASGSDTRIGPRCSHFDECFVTTMRARAEDAQIVVVNHHLYFADLALRRTGAGVIPDHDAVIFDEAHRVEDVATLFFGVTIGELRVERLVQDAERALAAVGRHDAEADRVLATVLSRADTFFDRLPHASGGDEARVELPSGLFEGAGADAYHALDAALEALALRCDRESERSEALAQLARRATRLRDEASQVADGTDRARVTWCEARAGQRVIGASPIDVSAVFRDEVIHRVPSVILSSATLTTNGTFDFVKRRLGIDFEVDEASLPSPFDYPSQAALYLPALPDPRGPEYPEAAIDEVVRLVTLTGGGAFVLTTSVRMMRRLAEGSRARLRGRPLYVQGEAPKAALLARFRDDHDAVLFATLSFWEGVDVPGAALRLVILDKIPFAVPTDPLVEARCRRLEEEGEAAFIRYLVPGAALTLKQGFGRLVRTREDRGVVAVLDSRLRSKGYGQVFLRSLPDAQRCHAFDEVERFWRQGPPARSAPRVGGPDPVRTWATE